ncbi:Phenylalanine--tRNA ligase alpha subunit, cytoplasmic [Camellia lanceoleosa]|uniref:Phenylalanine--tRNA ligase alpha subunit, cytoplasmic n=1 Tax=Camellia lanceoleosa TaxID=1840588 RepID=A0ACC0GXK1_9ERIC|nr:Phenylalanine--tRNA ligase alpha subunit, cytoplasmic [Camellia lanceoleosa]
MVRLKGMHGKLWSTNPTITIFEEMPTNNFILFDAFLVIIFIVPPMKKFLPEDYVERVKRVHEFGGYGSRGYEYDWKREEANKNLLRTHTSCFPQGCFTGLHRWRCCACYGAFEQQIVVSSMGEVQCGDVEFEKKIDEKIGQFIDRVEKHPSKKIDEKIGQF